MKLLLIKCRKILFALVISFFFSYANYSNSKIINIDFFITTSLTVFSVALAITAIFFTVIDRYKQNNVNLTTSKHFDLMLSEMVSDVMLTLYIFIFYLSIALLHPVIVNLESITCIKLSQVDMFIQIFAYILLLMAIYDITITIKKLISGLLTIGKPDEIDELSTKEKVLINLTRKLDKKSFDDLIGYIRKLHIMQDYEKKHK